MSSLVSFHEDTSLSGQSPTYITLFNLNYFLIDPILNMVILRAGLSHMNWEGGMQIFY